MEQNNSDIELNSKQDALFIQETPRLRWFTVLITTMVIVLIAVSVVTVIYWPAVAIYVPIITVGLALALQKYNGEFRGVFCYLFLKNIRHGDRIRIGNIKGDVRRMVYSILHWTR